MADNYKYIEDNMELKDVYIGPGGWRNFSGTKTDNNKSGERKFTIFLPEDLYYDLYEEGWNVKHKEEYAGKNCEYILDIFIRFDVYPPSMMKLKSADGSEVILTEETVGMLDSVDIKTANVVINPYNWDVNGKQGVKAYLDQIEVVAKPPRRSLRASLSRNEEE